jgi:hypothetical protein
VLADLADGDAVQPRPGVGARDVIVSAAAERGEERLGGHVLGDLAADTGTGVAQDRVRVPVEDRSEAAGISQRLLDERRIADLPGWRLRGGPFH